MRTTRSISLAGALLLAFSAGAFAEGQALGDLMDIAPGISAFVDVPRPAQPVPYQGEVPQQRLPENNDEPGFQWPGSAKGGEDDYILTGNATTFLKISPDQSADLAAGTGKCELSPKTKYLTASMPGFEGEHMVVTLKAPLPGCALTKGYVFMEHVAASSAGGAWQLPRNARAFIDTLAYAEGTDNTYNFIFTHVTFKSYMDHPRRVICSGRLCSTAAGRYQFLSDTWDPLAQDLGLKDFSPPSQDKAVMELIRRGGAYNSVAASSNFESFKKALSKLNGIWASLPGSPYGQPTHSTAALWKHYKACLAKY